MLTLLPLLLLSSSLAFATAARATQGQQTICCRSSGGTRGTCLQVWAHLVPPGNRFVAGPSRPIGLLQGPAASPTAMSVQINSLAGQRVTDQTLPTGGPAVWVLTLPSLDRSLEGQPLVWESFPTCRPDKPPTRTLLETGSTAVGTPSPLTGLVGSCGKEVATAPLLRAFELADWGDTLPVALPVHCLPLKAVPATTPPLPGNGATPGPPGA